MKYAILQCVTPFQVWPSKAEGAHLWKSLQDGGTFHSKKAATLPYLVARCERAGLPYRISAFPGKGYHLELVK